MAPAVGWAGPWLTDGTEPGVGGATACLGGTPRDGDCDGGWGGAASDGGAVLPGGVVLGVGEGDGGRGVGEAGQIFTGRRPDVLQGPAAAGSARTNGEAASSRAAADAYEAVRIEFILTIVGFHVRQGGNPRPVRLPYVSKKAGGADGGRFPSFAAAACLWNRRTRAAAGVPAPDQAHRPQDGQDHARDDCHEHQRRQKHHHVPTLKPHRFPFPSVAYSLNRAP